VTEQKTPADTKWFCPCKPPFHLAGFKWFEHDRIYRRLPEHPDDKVPEAVDNLANSTAGGQIRFQSDTTQVVVRVKLAGPANMNHMPATGQCGFDIYVGPTGDQTFYNVAKYDRTRKSYEVRLFEHPVAEMRNFTLNFPLYQGVDEILVGLDPHSTVAPPPAYAWDKCIVIYGTSITQGGCASRPGMAYTNILSRALNVEVVNLGFSGNGRGEPELARTIAGIHDPGLFVLDYEANCCGLDRLRRTLPEFISILRKAHSDVPILVVSRIRGGRENHNKRLREEREERLSYQRRTVNDMRELGDSRLHFFDATDLLGDDFDECTVDGSHPTDLGFLRMARGLEPVIRSIIFSNS